MSDQAAEQYQALIHQAQEQKRSSS
jgi:hypothetical protein